MPKAELSNYIMRCASLSDRPRKVRIKTRRTADGLWHHTMPLADLDYLIAREFEHRRQLLINAAKKGVAKRTSKIPPKHQTNTKPKHRTA